MYAQKLFNLEISGKTIWLMYLTLQKIVAYVQRLKESTCLLKKINKLSLTW